MKGRPMGPKWTRDKTPVIGDLLEHGWKWQTGIDGGQQKNKLKKPMSEVEK